MRNNTCTECGSETIWTNRICTSCKQDADPTLTTHDLFVAGLPPQAHTIRRIGR